MNEDTKGVGQLLEFGANVNIQDNDHWTPLHVAAACASKEMVELLLKVIFFFLECNKLQA